MKTVYKLHKVTTLCVCCSAAGPHIGDEPCAACQNDVKLRAVVEIAAPHCACTFQPCHFCSASNPLQRP